MVLWLLVLLMLQLLLAVVLSQANALLALLPPVWDMPLAAYLSVAALLLGVGAIAYVLGLLIVRPLDRLTQGARKVASGDLQVDLPVVSSGAYGSQPSAEA